MHLPKVHRVDLIVTSAAKELNRHTVTTII
uniref:Uncharacterized protein n=1 Tax=Anguilla anguilla TaxID=7936 RepID=A0A0E9UZ75_ANGAN